MKLTFKLDTSKLADLPREQRERTPKAIIAAMRAMMAAWRREDRARAKRGPKP